MGSSTTTLGGAPLSKQTGELCSFITAFNPISFVSPFLFLESFFFFLFSILCQASLRSTSGVAFSLESEDSEGRHRSVLLCSLPLLLFMPLSCPFLLLWQSPLYPYLPLVILLRFPHPFFNSPYALSQDLPRSEERRVGKEC